LYFKKDNISLGVCILPLSISSILYTELGLFNNIHNVKKISKNDIIYLLGIDNFLNINIKENFIIFQGHHINLEKFNVNLIFPNVTFLEKSSNFLSINGNYLNLNFILYPPFFCRND